MNAKVFINAQIATMTPSSPYGLIPNGAIAVLNGKIDWVGSSSALPMKYQIWEQEDVNQRLITPALIDCHTHLIYGGNRAQEFEMRLQGASYEDIALAGGGVVSTVQQTRNLSEDQLVQTALPRLDHFIAEGVTTLEIKSGYGLTIDDELKMLRAARRLQTLRPIRIKTTFLGAHAVPQEYKGNADAYLDEICLPALTQAAKEGLVDAVDAFCETIGFSPAQVQRVFALSKELNLPVKIHAEQLSDQKGAILAASFHALSADHLEYLSLDGIEAMKASQTVAVLLPGAFYTLRETQLPPIDGLRKNGVPMAIASDSNPGSSPLTSLLLCLNMACTLFRMTPEEALTGVTRHGAQALGLSDKIGTLETGKIADLAIWNVEHPNELAYRIGYNPLIKRIYGDA
ncbi:imidazolonepropionase [Terasakiella brassicae]|uniref:Imidazolonepropionase n=1 Tax=Terasakiella brassicae TaxID=1634917 RepID=A0A917FEZ1_9PROT|nr:imidazolonepropionase [Terasakiella brassicae]GGF69178.1 imidazolonepropionase [Terasakiella brassicae]